MVLVAGGGFYSQPSSSMLPTLPVGSAYLTLPLPADRLPKRGTIAVFEHPQRPGVEFVKRVIGLPGDRVAVINGVLNLNGAEVAREKVADFVIEISARDRRPNDTCAELPENGGFTCALPQWRETLPGGRSYAVLDQGESPADNFPEVEVPDAHVFVLGDHRDNSIDSRFPNLGMVPLANLKQEPWRFYISLQDPKGAFERFLSPIGGAK